MLWLLLVSVARKAQIPTYRNWAWHAWPLLTCHTCVATLSWGKGQLCWPHTYLLHLYGKQKMRKILLVYWRTSWCCSSIPSFLCPRPSCYHTQFELVRLYFQCVCTDTAELLILAPTVNAIASVRNLQITLDVRRIVPRKTICNIVRAFSHLYTTIPLVTSQRTGESPVLMTLLITKWQS